ncbi:MAG: acetolactate synthase small subunit [Anaerolineae bacterium]|jgi:acetolactate synthase-1/3 small subunit|nr:acetolactate synthase small subunit [Anaerolineae bacterium]
MSAQPTKKHIIAALVENKPGVLNRVVSLFRRRNFNVDSLTVGRTHKPHISRITLVIDAARLNPRQMAANLYKLVNVVDVKVVSEELHVERDLALIKVRTDDTESYNSVTELCERYPTRIIDMGSKVAIVEITARAELVEEFIDKLKPIGIIELVRTGVVAMGRGTRIQDTEYEPVVYENGQNAVIERFSV